MGDTDMAMPITPERAAQRAEIAAALRAYGPQTSRQIYSNCKDMPDITECCRLIGEMRKAGELITEGKVHWIVDRIRPEGWTAEQERVLQESRAAGCPPEDEPQPEPAEAHAEPEPERQAFELLPEEVNALMERDTQQDEPEPDLVLWYSNRGYLSIGYEDDVPLQLNHQQVQELIAFLKHVGLVP